MGAHTCFLFLFSTYFPWKTGSSICLLLLLHVTFFFFSQSFHFSLLLAAIEANLSLGETQVRFITSTTLFSTQFSFDLSLTSSSYGLCFRNWKSQIGVECGLGYLEVVQVVLTSKITQVCILLVYFMHVGMYMYMFMFVFCV